MSEYTFYGRNAALTEGVYAIIDQQYSFDEESFEAWCEENNIDMNDLESEITGLCEQHSDMPSMLWSYIEEHTDWTQVVEALKQEFPTPPPELTYEALVLHSRRALDKALYHGKEAGLRILKQELEGSVRRKDIEKVINMLNVRLRLASEATILMEELD
jgi:hypothetical protein